jgi:polysaccharide biosynthesis transport protein
VRGVDPRNLPVSAEMRVLIENDPVLRYYRQQVEQLDIQIEAYKNARMGANHREMRLLQAQRDAYFDREKSRRDELIDDLRSRQVESLRTEQARVHSMRSEVLEQLAEREAAQKDLDQTIQQIKNWERDADMLEKQREEIGKNLLAAENQVQTQSQEGVMRMVIAPRDAILPSRPNLITWLGGGFVLALMAAAGLAFLREFTDQALRTPIDVARFGRLSVLGCVPALDYEEADVADVEQATRKAPTSLVAEAFRQIRAHLTFSGPLESQRTLLITSPRADDGKTAIAVNLAVTLAQANQRVLLIDCNFRRPAVRRAFRNTRSDGLSNILIRSNTLAELITKTELPNLDVLASGPLPPNPAELLSSTAMRELLEAAKQKYERIILDGPPCLLISDALVIATLVDGVVLVARAVSGTKGTLRRAREQLGLTNARVIGAVLNGVEARPGGYFRQQYREFYEYTEDESAPRELTAGPDEIDADAGGPKS